MLGEVVFVEPEEQLIITYKDIQVNYDIIDRLTTEELYQLFRKVTCENYGFIPANSFMIKEIRSKLYSNLSRTHNITLTNPEDLTTVNYKGCTYKFNIIKHLPESIKIEIMNRLNIDSMIFNKRYIDDAIIAKLNGQDYIDVVSRLSIKRIKIICMLIVFSFVALIVALEFILFVTLSLV